LVRVAAGLLRRPAGTVTEVFKDAADREAAYRLVENEAVPVEEIAGAAHRAAAGRCAGEAFAYVPVDQSSLAITDESGDKGLGIIGPRRSGASGLQVMSAIAVAPDGTPVGICGQTFWARTSRSKGKKKNDNRPTVEKETQRWLDVMKDVHKTFNTIAPTTRPWFQLDRGADAWPVLFEATKSTAWLTVRAAYDRRLEAMVNGERDYLWPRLSRQEPSASDVLHVPGRGGKRARSAVMQLQTCRVTLDFNAVPGATASSATLWAVRAVEIEPPAGQTAIEWMLLTTFPVDDAIAAQQVVHGYATRWRIEEFHRIWKTGGCNVEDTQMRELEHIVRWATLHASVAMRLLRLTYLARTAAQQPATVELSRHEIDAVILSRKPKGARRGDTPTIGVIVAWIADEGGYTGKSSGGPPGAVVIARGLERIQVIAKVLADGNL
jgi:hypothetical protein